MHAVDNNFLGVQLSRSSGSADGAGARTMSRLPLEVCLARMMPSRSTRSTVPETNVPSSITGTVLAPESMVEAGLRNTKGKGESTERRIGITMAHIEKLRIRRGRNGFHKRYHRGQQWLVSPAGGIGRQLDNAKYGPEGLTSCSSQHLRRRALSTVAKINLEALRIP
jgi:hypothetical protein